MSYYLALKGLAKTSRRSKSLLGSYDDSDKRQKTIKVINELLEGDSLEGYIDRWYDLDNSLFTEEQLKKIYTPVGYMAKTINELMLLSPTFDNFNTIVEEEIEVLDEVLEGNKWNFLRPEIFETLETKGDFYAYWYYDEEDNIRLKVLESENVSNVIIDANGDIKKLVYKEYVLDEDIDDSTGLLHNKGTYEVTTIIGEGYIRINDPKKYKKGFKVFPNKLFEKDVLRLVYVPSYKKRNSKFSKIPASRYIDLVMLLEAISTDIRYINKLLGFPIAWLFDGDIDEECSSFVPGGKVEVTTKNRNDLNSHKANLILAQITNGLETITKEKKDAENALSKMSGLIREELEQAIGSSDSSRVVAQLRLTLENKFAKYFHNIAEGFKPFFRSALKNKNIEPEKEVTFEKLDQYINSSIYDQLSITNSKLAIGKTTMQEEWDNEGMTKKEKQKRRSNIKEEVVLGNEDVKFEQEAEEVGVDNQMKQDKNIKGGEYV